jgi:uncharacterized protein
MLTFEQGEEEYENSNYTKAFNIFIILAEIGDMRAQLSVACMYESGEGIQKDLTKSVKWYRIAAEKGHPIAQNNLAVILLDTNPEEAIQWLFMAAENNFSFAQSMLGDIHYGYYNLPPNIRDSMKNISEAVKWYQKAGKGGFYSAYHQLAEMFANGQGVEKDERHALEYYLSAAEKGYEPSQEFLSKVYMEGLLGLSKDLQLSQYWFTQARLGKE